MIEKIYQVLLKKYKVKKIIDHKDPKLSVYTNSFCFIISDYNNLITIRLVGPYFRKATINKDTFEIDNSISSSLPFFNNEEFIEVINETKKAMLPNSVKFIKEL